MPDSVKGRRTAPVSVVIPTYNRARLICRAVESALRAVQPGDEIIVVDDGSTDGTEGTLTGYAGRVTYVRTENRGAGPARNLGVELARSDWIAFLDSDDEWKPDHLDLHRGFLARSDALFSFSNFDVCYDDAPGKCVSPMSLVMWSEDPRGWDEILGAGVPYSRYAPLPAGREDFRVHQGSMYHPMVRASYIPAWTALIRRDVAGSRLRFPEDLPTYEDYECLSRLAKFGTAAYLDCATAVNHGHAGPRLTGVNHLAKATSRIAILERIWGSDEEYLRCHREEYEAVLAAQRLVRVKELVLRGQTRTARRELRGLAGVPLSVQAVAALPEGLARLFLGACGRRVR